MAHRFKPAPDGGAWGTGALWRQPYALLFLPPLFWAGNLLIGRAFAAELPPFSLAFWRWVIALTCILPFVWHELRSAWPQLLTAWPLIFACAASGYAGYPVLNYIALQTTPAATAAILNSTLPLMLPLIAWAVARERPSARVLAGVAVSFVGVAWIVSRGERAALQSLSIGLGEILVLLAVACFALYSVLLRYRPPSLPPLLFLAATFAATIICLAPFCVWEMQAGRSIPAAPFAVASLLFIGIFASLVANLMWNRCVAVLGAAVTGASFHLMAVYSSALAFILLGEPIQFFHLIGTALILLGFAMALRRR